MPSSYNYVLLVIEAENHRWHRKFSNNSQMQSFKLNSLLNIILFAENYIEIGTGQYNMKLNHLCSYNMYDIIYIMQAYKMIVIVGYQFHGIHNVTAIGFGLLKIQKVMGIIGKNQYLINFIKMYGSMFLSFKVPKFLTLYVSMFLSF